MLEGPGLDSNDPQAVAFMSDALPHYARTASMLGGEQLTGLAEKHIRFIYSGLGGASGGQRREILAACARYAEFLGWLHQDLGNPVISLFWTDRALEWAQEAEPDGQFVSYVLMRKSDHAEQYGTPGRVISLARSALSVPALSPRARALAVQQEARGHAQGGNRELFQRRLDEARELVVRSEGSGEAPWGEYCGLTYLAMQEASGQIELGDFGTAIEIIERELPGMPATDRVDFVVFRARLARAYAEAGYADHAAQTALMACEGARITGSERALAELRRVREILASRADGGPAATSFAGTFDPIGREFGTRTWQLQ
jgi:hypothetical protein